MKLNKTREQLKQMFIDCLEKEDIPWKKCWKISSHYNPQTKHYYSGVNAMRIAYEAYLKGYKDTRWMTMKNIKDNGYHLNAGSKGVPIEYWYYHNDKTKQSLTLSEASVIFKESPELMEGFTLKVNTYYIFNGSCIEGIPPLEEQIDVSLSVNLKECVDKVVDGLNVPVYESNDGRAYYLPSRDEIYLPPIKSFENESYYSSTLLHECAHATGHSSRLNRDLSGFVGTEKYAKEELRAEIASAFLSEYMPYEETEEHKQNHQAYIQSWIKAIKKEPTQLFSAINDAEHITDYIVEKAGLNRHLEIKKELPIRKTEEINYSKTPNINNRVTINKKR